MYDAIVLGTGGVGSAALYHLARRGARVLGLDRFPPGHDRGSSHGQTRAVRQAYFEHPDYVPLILRSYQLWHELEAECGRQLYCPVGLLEVGPPDGIVVPGVLRAARQHGLAVEELSHQEVAQRWPGFVLPADSLAVFEREAGYLRVEECVLAHLELARRHGSELRTGEAVKSWQEKAGHVSVQTDSGTYQAERLVIAAGAWSAQLCRNLGVPLAVLTKHLHWYASDSPHYRQENGCPVFFFETAEGFYYGFPQTTDEGVKIAEHSGGTPIENPLTSDRDVDPADRRRVESFLASHLPEVSPRPTGHSVCFYTMSPDEHFLVDRHPLHPRVALAAGLSGHGFKLTSALGEILADLTLDTPPPPEANFLRLGRFGT